MKRYTKLLVLAALVALLVCALCVPALADTEGDYTYTVSNGYATITKYNGSGGDVTIPSKLGGYPVVNINWAFKGCSSLTSVIIPEGVRSIHSAFADCCNLTSATIPSTVSDISYAFEGCSSLTSVTLPSGITSIGTCAFSRCSALTNVTIPSKVTRIEQCAFQACSSLTSITIPDGVTSIDDSAFYLCRGLQGIVEIPSGITSIGAGAFMCCDSLTGISVDPDNQFYKSVDGVLFDKSGSVLIQYPNGKCGDYTVPDGVTSIGDHAFYVCRNLTGITIPDGVTSIGYDAFIDCSSLTNVTLPESLRVLGAFAFCQCSALESINIPEGITKLNRDVFSNCYSLKSLTIPSSVTSIAESAISGCDKLTIITIPAGVTNIEDGAFSFDRGLTEFVVAPDNPSYKSVDGVLLSINGTDLIQYPTGKGGTYTVPAGVSRIHDYAFEGCENLIGTLLLPEGITTIGNSAFWACSRLTGISLPSSLTEIGSNAISAMYELNTILYAGTQDGWSGIQIGENNASLDNAEILFNSIPVLAGDYTYLVRNSAAEILRFSGSAIGALEIPTDLDGYPVTRIGDGTYYGCSGITRVTIPASVTDIGIAAFQGCSGLSRLTIPEGVIKIDDYAFASCTGLTAIAFPLSLRSIGDNAFNDCTYGLSVYYAGTRTQWINEVERGYNNGVLSGNFFYGSGMIPEVDGPCTYIIVDGGAQLIGYLAEGGTTVEVTLPSELGGVPLVSIYDSTFSGFRSMTSVSIPSSVTSIGTNAFVGCFALTDVYFGGGRKLWAQISIGTGNEYLTRAKLHCAGEITATEGDFTYTKSDGEATLDKYGGSGSIVSIPSVLGGCPVTRIGNDAFRSCSSLTGITIPSSVTSIGNYAFYNCYKLTGLTLPANLTSIEDYAFYYCYGLTEITLPANLTSVGAYGFYNCDGLTEITLPASVSEIGDNAFADCSALTTISVEPSSLSYMSLQGVLFDKTGNTLIQFPGGQSGAYTIPDFVTGVAGGAFKGCSGLVSVMIPSGVTSIGYQAFYSCSGLTSFTVAPENPSYKSLEGVLCDKPGKTLIQYPCGKNGAYTIPDSVQELSMAFHNCLGLTQVTIPAGMQYIVDLAFMGCKNLKSVTIPDSVTRIGSLSFLSCSALSDIYYLGTQEQWDAITIGASNAPLLNATLHFVTPLTITAQPSDVTVAPGKTASFTVATSGGTSALTYQWYVKKAADGAWEKISGATAATYSLTAKARHDGYAYYCKVSDGTTTVSSEIATLTILAPLTITTQPGDVECAVDTTAAFTVAVNGGVGDISYKWYVRKTADGDWSAISGATSATYSLTVKARHNGYAYYCKVSDGTTTVNSEIATLTIQAPLTITTQPGDVECAIDTTAAFTVAVNGGVGDISYKWYVRKTADGAWEKISGATAATYSLTAKARHDGYAYYCKVSDGTTTVNSEIATLTILAPLTITTQPEDFEGAVNTTAAFTVATSGGKGNISYKWYVRKTADGDWSAISGATAATYSLTAKARHDGYAYYCKVSDGTTTVNSEIATLTILAPLTITTQPENFNGPVDTTAAFTVAVNGGVGDISYKWYVRKTADGDWSAITGATAATYSLTAKARHDGYAYYCKVSDGTTTVNSEIATLTILAPLTITTQPEDFNGSLNTTAAFTVVASGGKGAPTYQWYVKKTADGDWSAISGATAATYSLTVKARHDGYAYYCKVSDGTTTVNSETATLTILAPLTIDEQPEDFEGPADETAEFTVSASGGVGALTYQWYVLKTADGDWTVITADSAKTATYSLTVKARHNGYQYKCLVSDGQSEIWSEVVTLTVN